MTTLFSLITITRNNVEGLRKTYHSIAMQTCRDFEWIVVDGSSGDGTVDFLRNISWADWVSESDRGLYDAMNKGITRAKGEYLLFLNAGDMLANVEVLAGLKKALPPSQIKFLYGDSWEESGLYKKAKPHTQRAQGMFTHHQAMLYHRVTLGDMRYDTRYKIAADFDLTCRFLDRLLKETEKKCILYWPNPICVFEDGGVSQTNAAQGRAEHYDIVRTLGLHGQWRANLTYARHVLAWYIRMVAPWLYRWWRNKK